MTSQSGRAAARAAIISLCRRRASLPHSRLIAAASSFRFFRSSLLPLRSARLYHQLCCSFLIASSASSWMALHSAECAYCAGNRCS